MQAQVDQGNGTSKEFLVTNAVKRGCVLAPTLFSFYLTAMLEGAFKDAQEGIYIQTRYDADLFNVSQFKAKTRMTWEGDVCRQQCSGSPQSREHTEDS